jgi:hypothetical protein
MEEYAIRIVTCLVAATIGAATDIRKGLIYDKLTLPLIVFGILLDVIFFNPVYFLVGLGVFVFGLAAYYLGWLGGGDVKLFVGSALVLPLTNGLPVLFVSSLINAMVFASTIVPAIYIVKYARKGIDVQECRQELALALVLCIAMLAYIYIIWTTNLIDIRIILFFMPAVLLSLTFLGLQRGIKRHFFMKWVDVDSLEEDEVVAKEFLTEKMRSTLNLGVKGILTEKDVEVLRKAGIKKVPIYTALPPFGPFFLAGLIFSLIMPEFYKPLFELYIGLL